MGAAGKGKADRAHRSDVNGFSDSACPDRGLGFDPQTRHWHTSASMARSLPRAIEPEGAEKFSGAWAHPGPFRVVLCMDDRSPVRAGGSRPFRRLDGGNARPRRSAALAAAPPAGIVDRERVERAIAAIRRRVVGDVSAAFLDVGRLLLDMFFAGDPASYRSRRRRDPSFDALLADARIADLGLSRTRLYDCIRTHIQRIGMDDPRLDLLPFSHQVEILRAPEGRKREILDGAAGRDLSVRDLREMVVRARAEEPAARRGGRPRVPALERGLAELSRAVDLVCGEDVTASGPAPYTPDQLAQRLAEIDRHLVKLAAFARRLSSAVPRMRPGDLDEPARPGSTRGSSATPGSAPRQTRR